MTAATSGRSLATAHLALDHRGDRQHVEDGQVLASRVAQVDAREVLPEREQLLGDELLAVAPRLSS